MIAKTSLHKNEENDVFGWIASKHFYFEGFELMILGVSKESSSNSFNWHKDGQKILWFTAIFPMFFP